MAARASVLVLSLLMASTGDAAAQPVGNVEERRLEFVEARIRHEEAERGLARARELHEIGLRSQEVLEEKQVSLKLAEVQVRRTYLRLALADPEVVLRAARKYQDERGDVRVELDLVARWSVGLGTALVDAGVDSSLELPVVEGISNVVVSLKTTRGHSEGVLMEPTIVSIPYEERIPVLPFDELVTVDFGLLVADVQELLVELRYNDSTHSRQVLLGKRTDAGESVLVRSSQIALDAELGADAVYELSLERFDDDAAIYDLGLDGLPPEVSRQVTDPDSGAAFSQVFFPAGVTDRRLVVTLTLPSRPTAAVQPGLPLHFTVRLDPERSAGSAGEDRGRPAGELELAVVPRGVAALEVEAANLYHEVERGDAAELEVRLVNAGSRVLEQVELTVSVPFDWDVTVQPALFATVAPGAVETVEVAVTPPERAVLGDYEATIRAETLAGDRLVESEPKTLRLHVLASGNPWLATMLVLVVLAGLAGLIWAGVRLSRR